MDTQLEKHRIIRRDEVSRLTGLARATIYKKVADGSFPAPIRLGTRVRRLASVGCNRLAAGAGEAMGPV